MKLTETYPILNEWKTFRVGLAAVIIQCVCFAVLLFYFSDPAGPTAAQRSSLYLRCAQIVVAGFFSSSLIGMVGLFVDKRKPLSILASVLIIPEFFFLAMWAGNG